MKKIISLLLVAMMCVSLCACGGNETSDKEPTKDEVVNGGGFTPSKPSTETVVETEKEEINLEMTVEEMKEYYNDNEFVGTPRIETLQAYVMGENVSLENDNFCTTVKNESNNLKDWKWYECIICDNNTPDDTSDDVLAYIFTTPID